jgi:hypothetical protein
MSDTDNKIDNKLDFRNVKTSQLGGTQIERAEYSELQSAKRVFTTTPILKDAYTHFIQTVNAQGRPTYVEYWQATSPATDKLQMSADVAGSKAGTYFALQEYQTKKLHVFYYVANGVGVAPGIGDIETPIIINNNDSAALIAYASKNVIDALDEFTAVQPSILSSFLEISYNQFGDTTAIDVGTSGFITSRLIEGCAFKVGDVTLDYDVDGHPIYGGNALKGLLYNPYTASFDVERDEIVVTAVVSLDPIISKDPTVYNVAMPSANTEYSLALPLETKRFQMNIQNHSSKYTVSWVSGGPIITKSPGTVYEEQSLEIVTGKDTIYFTGKKNNLVMEIITWK